MKKTEILDKAKKLLGELKIESPIIDDLVEALECFGGICTADCKETPELFIKCEALMLKLEKEFPDADKGIMMELWKLLVSGQNVKCGGV